MNAPATRLVLGLGLATMGAGFASCTQQIDDPWAVHDLRPLGLRVTAIGDAGSATPVLGEPFDVALEIAHPVGNAPALEWSVAACLAPPGADSTTCGRLISPRVSGVGLPVGAMIAPTPPAMETPRSIAMLSIICVGGRPSLDDMGRLGCSAGTTERVSTRHDVALRSMAETPNRNPSLDAATMALDGVAWPASATELTECPATPTVEVPHLRSDGANHLIRLDAADVRESFFAPNADATEIVTLTEDPVVAWYATLGSFDRRFTRGAMTPTSANTHSTDWRAPLAVPAPRIVKFWFAMHDGRGGLAVASRILCVVP